MDMSTMLALRAAGVDTEGALRRFSNNAELYERFLLKFPQDKNFSKIGPALMEGDFETVLNAAHTLKGVSGNLGMDRLYRTCSELVSLLRADHFEEAKDSFRALEAAYQELCQALTEPLEGAE